MPQKSGRISNTWVARALHFARPIRPLNWQRDRLLSAEVSTMVHAAARYTVLLLTVGWLAMSPATGQEALSSGDTQSHQTATTAEEIAAELSGIMVLRVSERFLKEIFTRDINTQTPVQRVVLGTRAQGTAQTLGRAEVDTKPAKDDAAFYVKIMGTTTARTVGRNGPAIIHSRSVTHWKAVKTVRFDGKKFTTSPATISSEHCIQPLGAGSSLPGLRGRIVSRIASRRAVQYNHTAERITARDTERRVLTNVDRVVDGQIDKLNDRLTSRPLLAVLLPKLKDAGVEFSTSSKCINISFTGKGSPLLAKVLPIEITDPSDTELWFQTALVTGPENSIPELIEDVNTWLTDQLPGLDLTGMKLPGLSLPGIELANKSGVLPMEIKFVDDWIVVRPQALQERATRTDQAASKEGSPAR